MNDSDKFSVIITRHEAVILYLSLSEYKFQSSRDYQNRKNRNLITRLIKKYEKFIHKEMNK